MPWEQIIEKCSYLVILMKKKTLSDWIEIETKLIATDLDKHIFALRLIKTNSKTAQEIFLVVQI